ncbi:hypothetical protein H4R34_000085 [Dimargaris verticillata]|uniref:Methyltransferase domain-containing protein n=1 Tax=Dimargaris verticillata TaxID=2761393 RepID=A0A9W8B8S0_9FUNG|nr:hypothetical protein H4R34_000085 [Dimargaris verticillata]
MPRLRFGASAHALHALRQRLSNALDPGQAEREWRWLVEHALALRNQPRPSTVFAPTPRYAIQRLRSKFPPSAGLTSIANHSPTAARLPNPFPETRALTRSQQHWLHWALFERIHHHKPLQYILGTQPFGALDILTRPPTLIPRWETEEWVLWLADQITQLLTASAAESGHQRPKGHRIVDLCTGTGCIALALAHYLPRHSAALVGVDIAPTAYQLARANQRNHRNKVRNGVKFTKGDALSAKLPVLLHHEFRPLDHSQGLVDMVVTNPPYVPLSQYRGLAPEVKRWEDPVALIPRPLVHCADADLAARESHQLRGSPEPTLGVEFYTRLIPHLVQHRIIQPSGHPSPRACDLLSIRRLGPSDMLDSVPRLVMEIGGSAQVQSIGECLARAGFTRILVRPDLAGNDRVVLAW